MSVDKRHLLKSAYNYTQAGQWDRALEEYRKVTKLFPDDPNIHSMIADLLGKKGDGVGAAREHLEAARYFKQGGQDEKELSSLRKALRMKAGDADAVTAIAAHFAKALQDAKTKVVEGKLEEAEAIGNRLLDADPGHLEANRLLDEVKAARLKIESIAAMEEEALVADSEPGAGEVTREVLARLQSAATAYLQAEDFDNAMETLLVMLKLDPASPQLQFQLEQTQEQMRTRQAAQAKWQEMQAKQAAELETVKTDVREQVDLDAWRDEEEAVRKRLEEEQRIAEESAKAELSIIENAVRELSASVVPTQAAAGTAGAEDQARLQALMEERALMQKRLEEEQELARQREKDAEARRGLEAERLTHAIELAKIEAESKAKADALEQLEARLRDEREVHKRELETERERVRRHEAELQMRMKEMMRSEMEKLRAEVTATTTEQLKAQLETERKRLAEVEAAVLQKERATEAQVTQQRSVAASAAQLAEEAARKERDAIAKLKKEEDERRQSFLEQAMKRRQARQGAAGDERSAVLRNSRKISDVLHAATTKHLGEDVDAMLETAKRYLKQDLLLDAMRICQKIAEKDPDNEKVKALLKEIYVRKGI